MAGPVSSWGGGKRRTEQYYDRGATKILKSGFNTTGAATLAQVTDWTYTVPTGKACFVEYLHARCIAKTAAALNGRATAEIVVTPSGGSAHVILIAEIRQGEGPEVRTPTVGAIGLLKAGDNIIGRSVSDNSETGSDVNLGSSMMATEFDA